MPNNVTRSYSLPPHSIQPSAKGTGWTLPGRPNLRIPVVAGRIPCGRLIANSIERITTAYTLDRFVEASDDVETICHDLASLSQPSLARLGKSHFRGGSVLDGVLGQGQIFAALLAQSTPDRRVDGLRACLLACSLAPDWPRGVATAVDTVAKKILTATNDDALVASFPQALGSIDRAIWKASRLTELLTPFTTEPEVELATSIRRAALIVSVILSRNEAPPKPCDRKTKPPRLRKQAGTRFVRPISKPAPELDVPEELPLDDLLEPDAWIAPPVTEIDDETEEDSDVTAGPVEKPASTQVADFERISRTQSYMYGVLLPSTERTMTCHECQRLFGIFADFAFEILFTQAEKNKLLGYTALVLVLLTGRDLPECATAISNLLNRRTNQSGWLQIDRNCSHWIGSYPITYPAAPSKQTGWTLLVASKIQQRLPPELTHVLQALAAATLPRSDSRYVYQCAEEAMRELRRSVLPRLTLTRLGNTVATTLYAQTGHSLHAQLIYGNDLAQSSAPLHYYAAPASVLAEHYRSALADLGIIVPAENPSKIGGWIGAPSAAIQQSMLQHAVHELVERTKSTIHVAPNSGIDQWIAAWAAIQNYTAILFGVCTAFRFTSAIGEIKWGQIIELPRLGEANAQFGAGIAIVCDKGADKQVAATRACALPLVLVDQLSVLRDHHQRLLSKLRGETEPGLRLLQQWLADSLNGVGPAWFVYDPLFGTCEPCTRRSLTRAWPELPFPIQLFRHNFCSRAVQYSIRSCDVALQMGHSVGGDPFDDCDPDAPSDFAYRLSDNLGHYVSELGFRTLGTVHRRNRKSVPLPPETSAAILKAEQADQAAFSVLVSAATAKEQRQPATEEADVAVQSWQETCYKQMTSAEQVESIQKFLAGLAAERPDPHFQDAVRERLQRAMEVEAERQGRTIKIAIPRLCKTPLTISPIREVHLRAYRWATQLNDESLNAVAVAIQTGDTDRLLIHGVLLLALWGCGTRLDDLLALLDQRTELHTSPLLRGIVVTAVARSQHSAGDRSVQTIPVGAEAVVIALRRSISGNAIDRVTIEAALRDEQALLERIGASGISGFESALAIIHLARRVTASGQHCGWESGTLASVGPSLERFWTILHNDVSVKIRHPVPEISRHLSNAPPIARPMTNGFQAYKGIQQHLGKVQKAANSGRRRQQLIEYLAHTLDDFGDKTLIGICAKQIGRDLSDSRRVASTLQTYGSRLKPLFERFAGEDYRYSDVQQLLDECRHIAITQHSGTAQRQSAQPTATALSWLSEAFTGVGLTLDYEEALADISIPTIRHPGYLCSKSECEWLIQQAITWNKRARENPDHAAHSHYLTAAGIASILQFHSGMRLSEVAGLRVTDLTLYHHGCLVNIRYRASRRLKTRSSSRPIFCELDAYTMATLRDMLDTLRARRIDTGNDLLATEYRAGVSRISNRYASVMNPILNNILPTQCARLHAARHTQASAAGYLINRERFGFDLEIGFADPTEANILRGLPHRDLYRYYSRKLGHGHPRTTLIHYDHTIALQSDSARGWILPSNKLMGALLERAGYRSLAKRLTAKKEKSQAFVPNYLQGRDCSVHTYISDAAPAPLPLPSITESTNFELINTLARITLRRREGLAPTELANEVGLTQAVAEQWVEWLQLIDGFLKTQYFPVMSESNLDSRVPRAHRHLPFVRKIQRLLANGDIDVGSISAWVMRQGRDSNSTEISFLSTDEILRNAFIEAKILASQRCEQLENRFAIGANTRSYLLLVLFGYSEAVLHGNSRISKNSSGIRPWNYDHLPKSRNQHSKKTTPVQ